MRACYEELARPKGAPLATWQDAFKKHSLVVLMDVEDACWSPWSFDFWENDRLPGDGPPPARPSIWSYVKAELSWLERHFETHDSFAPLRKGAAPERPATSWFERALESAPAILRDIAHAVDHGVLRHELTLALHYVEALMGDAKNDAKHHKAIAGLLRDFRDRMRSQVEPNLKGDVELRRAWILLGLGTTMVIGMLEDGVVTGGFEMIEDEEWIAWLGRHGADALLTGSALVRGMYDLVFAFEGGDPSKPNFAAGTAMRSVMSIVFEYRGAIFWKMQAGMGDTVFGPFYEVLKKRGVKIEFFHQVEHLGLSEDGGSIGTLRIGRQVWLKDHEKDPEREYHPLFPVKGLPCWPSVPLYDQLDPAQVKELLERKIDLESPSSGWVPCETRTLVAGTDFDVVVLAIPPGAQRGICRELIGTDAAFRSMVDNVQTVATQAAQLWLEPDLAGLGWSGQSPIMDAYADSLNTWADMSHLIPREDWPPERMPRNIAYFCGQLQDATPEHAELALTRTGRHGGVREGTIQWMDAHAGALWPKATPPGNPAALAYDKLIAKAAAVGVERMDEQYFRANVEGSERYVLSLAGSAHYRLKAGGSGFSNLFCAGDWTDNGFLNAGCIEASVLSGLQAARAVSGDAHSFAWEREEEG
jgi:uncharacterized protein with NAD-binding domain and iron-sulfur cluster